MTDDSQLLRQFVEQRSEPAFRQFVQQRIGFVYASALRMVGGDPHVAEEVAQTVFLDLARKAAALRHRGNLTGWLYTSTRFAAAKALRSRSRRLARETATESFENVTSASTETNWSELRPVLDAALHELSATDRDAILLRYFDNLSLADVGATLGVSDNTARMRVDRTLEKLRTRLARRGITSTAAALGAALAGQPVVAAPAALVTSVTGVALAGAATSTGIGALVLGTLFPVMNTMKLAVTTVSAVALFSFGTYVGARALALPAARSTSAPADVTSRDVAALRHENHALHTEIAALRDRIATTAARANPSASAPAADASMTGKWRLLAELQNQKLVKTSINLVDGSGNLTDVAGTLFDLTPVERDALAHAVDAARQQMKTLELQNATVTRDGPNKITIRVQPFPDTGATVYDGFMKTFAQTLGPDRNAAFITLGQGQVERVFGEFGAIQRTLTVTADPTSTYNRYVANDQQVAPNDNYSSSSNYKSRDDLLRRVGSITELLPPDF